MSILDPRVWLAAILGLALAYGGGRWQQSRHCDTLPTIKPGATRADMLEHIRVTADLYARCAATP